MKIAVLGGGNGSTAAAVDHQEVPLQRLAESLARLRIEECDLIPAT